MTILEGNTLIEKFMYPNEIIGGQFKMAHNVPTLGEGGDFNHKC